MKGIRFLPFLLIGICLTLVASGAFASDPPLSCSGLKFGGSFKGCRDYSGSGWAVDQAGSDCSNGQGSQPGSLNIDGYCDKANALGYCVVDEGTEKESKLYFDNGDLKTLENACANFMNGKWISESSENTADRQVNSEDLIKETSAALTGDEKVTVAPNGCSDSELKRLLEEGKAIDFTPNKNSTSKGLIIYPEVGIDPRGYAVAARMIAENGFLVAIVPFPENTANTDAMRADNVILAHPEITDWAIAGHGEGGAYAAEYATADPMRKVKAIAFWAAYPPKSIDLYLSGLSGLSVKGTLDGIINAKEWENARARLPQATYVGDLNGGNHSQFQCYSNQAGDRQATISRKDQHKLFTGATIHLLNRINSVNDAARSTLNLISAATGSWPEKMGKDAQKIIAGLKTRDLPNYGISNQIIADQTEFQTSKPSFPEKGFALVDMITHSHQTANPSDVTQPPIYEGELWIKMKSQAAFVEEYGFTPENGGQRGCEQVNMAIFNYALKNTDWATYMKFRRSNVTLEFIEDIKTLSGPGWLDQDVQLRNVPQTKRYTLQASRLEVQTSVPEPLGGSFYCKVWSPVAAYNFIVDRANQR